LWRFQNIKDMQKTRYSTFAAASLVYIGFAVYLYQPYFENFQRDQFLLVANLFLASMGGYLLSRRWVSGFMESLLAGALYGFGPFILFLAKYHPAAGLLAASIPWLFLPAAFCPQKRRRLLSIALATLPFLIIVIFFQVTTGIRLFAVSTQARLNISELYSLLTPLVAAKRGTTLIGFYHVPIASLIMGFAMLVAARRFSIVAIFAIAIILTFCHSLGSIFEVSPIIWLTIGTLCCSIILAVGLQGFVSAGYADRKWILAIAIVMSTLAIVTLLLATKYFQTFLGLGSGYARVFVEAAKMYILGTVAVTIIFFLSHSKSRMHRLREIILFVAIALDVFLGATFIIDTIF
jgi:hypothetical protein